MTVTGRLLSGLQQRAVYASDVWGAWARGDDLPVSTSAAGVQVSQDKALRLSTAWACIRMLSEDVATLPVQTFTRDGDTRREVAKPRWMVAPNAEATWVEVIQQSMTGLLTDGNAALEVVRDRFAEPVELWPLDPRTVDLRRNSAGRPEFQITPETGSSYTLPWERMLYIRGFMLPGSTKGLSPIAYARETIGLGLASEQFGARFFGQGAQPGGVIEIPAGATQEQIDQLVSNWKKHHQGLRNSHEPGVLTGGATWQSVTIPPDDAQFLETRKFSVEEVARFYRVPLHKVNQLDRSTFSNIEQQAIEYVVDGVRPWLVRLESVFNALLRPGVFPKWNVEGLLRGDTKSRYEAYQIAHGGPWMSADEIRAKEDQNPIGAARGGDVILQPLNMAPLGTDPTEGNDDA